MANALSSLDNRKLNMFDPSVKHFKYSETICIYTIIMLPLDIHIYDIKSTAIHATMHIYTLIHIK